MSRVPAMAWLEGGPDTLLRWSEANRLIGVAFQWSDAQVLGDWTAGSAPAIAGVGNNTVMAWKAADPDHRIHWSYLTGSSLTDGGPM